VDWTYATRSGVSSPNLAPRLVQYVVTRAQPATLLPTTVCGSSALSSLPQYAGRLPSPPDRNATVNLLRHVGTRVPSDSPGLHPPLTTGLLARSRTTPP
jgi:hypothetical protein